MTMTEARKLCNKEVLEMGQIALFGVQETDGKGRKLFHICVFFLNLWAH